MELINCINLITDSLKMELKRFYSYLQITGGPDTYDTKGVARILLAMTDGLAFQRIHDPLIHDPQQLEDERREQSYRTVVLILLQKDGR